VAEVSLPCCPSLMTLSPTRTWPLWSFPSSCPARIPGPPGNPFLLQLRYIDQFFFWLSPITCDVSLSSFFDPPGYFPFFHTSPYLFIALGCWRGARTGAVSGASRLSVAGTCRLGRLTAPGVHRCRFELLQVRRQQCPFHTCPVQTQDG